MMRARYQLVDDPVFESVMRHGGAKPLEIRVKHPDQYEEFIKESDMINRKAEKATDVCVDSIIGYSLLTDPHAVFSSCLQVAQNYYNFQCSFDSHSDPAVRARAEKSKKWIVESYNAALLLLKDEKEKLEIRYRGQSVSEITQSLVSKATKEVTHAATNVGKYGRIELYTHMLGKLESQVRKARPEANLFIDLVIKGILASEPNANVRKASWENADLMESDTLRLRDVLVGALRKQA